MHIAIWNWVTLKMLSLLIRAWFLFLLDVVGKRDFPMEVILDRIEKAEKEMYDGGIVAVGDIGNTDNTVATKKKVKSNGTISLKYWVSATPCLQHD